jgi:ChrR Cupin-like domain
MKRVIQFTHQRVSHSVNRNRLHTLFDAFEREVTEGVAGGSDHVSTAVGSPRGEAIAQKRLQLLGRLKSVCRFELYVPALAKLLEIDEGSTRQELMRVDEQPFDPSLAANVSTLDIAAGPRWANGISGFVRVMPQTAFPHHEHLGEDLTFILQGALRERNGEIYRPGTLIIESVGSSHDFEVVSDVPLIYVAMAEVGIRIGEHVIGAKDPRL